MASRRVKLVGAALGLLAGLAGGLLGYRSYAARKRAAPAAAATAPPTAPPRAAPADGGARHAANAGDAGVAQDALTPAEREARLLERLDPAPAPAGPAPGAPSPLDAATSLDAALAASDPLPAPPPPGSPAAREAALLRRAAEGQLPAATQPLFRIGSPVAISAEGRARADSATHLRELEEERQARLAAWPPIAESDPPPGPPLPPARPQPRPRPPRLELPSRLDRWGE